MKLTLGCFVVVGCLLSPSLGLGQDLDEVESLALSGRAEAAREMLTAWWQAGFDDATRLDRQKGLWLRGLLTVDPDLAELDFQRLIVEYPGGPYTAEALVRLAGASEARNELDEARRFFTTLLRDYPGSRYQTMARAWLDSNATPSPERTEPGDSVVADSTSALPPPADSMVTTRDTTRVTPTEMPRSRTPAGRYAVQLGAFSSEARALTLLRVATQAGLELRVVQVDGNSLFRVRMGRFVSDADAEAQRARIVDLGFEATVVSNADREGS